MLGINVMVKMAFNYNHVHVSRTCVALLSFRHDRGKEALCSTSTFICHTCWRTTFQAPWRSCDKISLKSGKTCAVTNTCGIRILADKVHNSFFSRFHHLACWVRKPLAAAHVKSTGVVKLSISSSGCHGAHQGT